MKKEVNIFKALEKHEIEQQKHKTEIELIREAIAALKEEQKK